MAQNRAFSLGGIGSPCCCGGTGCSTKICVTGCFGMALGAATVTIGSSSGTTDGLGCVTLTIPSAGSYTVVISHSGFNTSTTTQTLACSGTKTIALTPATLFTCGGCHVCPDAIPTTLTASDGLGDVTLTFQSTFTLFPTGPLTNVWVGCAMRTIPNVCSYDSTCTTHNLTRGSVAVPMYFIFQCQSAGIPSHDFFALGTYVPQCSISGSSYYSSGQSCSLAPTSTLWQAYGGSVSTTPTQTCDPFDWSSTVSGNTAMGCNTLGVCLSSGACGPGLLEICDLYGCSGVTYTVTP